MHCNGKCFLMTKMREVHRQGHDNFVNGLEELLGKDLVYVFEAFTLKLNPDSPQNQRLSNFYYQSRLSMLHALAMLKPPAARFF